ncbi:MAG TPA: hypothetical protein VLT45_30955, partial [Kofleriaceae bacterium]|nr:hypothetical protein [Kofleriaceae bacterium]
LDDEQLVKGRVGTLEISCHEPGSHLLLDGAPLATCPATKKQRVLAGEHIVLGEKTGYLTVSKRVVIAGGTTVTDDLTLVPLESAVTLRYRYPRWMPYTVAGTGAAVALGGLAFYVAGRSQMDRFDADFATQCPQGCRLSDFPLLADERSSAKLRGTVGIAMLAGGGAIAITGAVLAVINSKAERILPSVEATPGGAVTSVGWRF